MEYIMGTLVGGAVAIALQLLISKICRENTALRRHEALLRLVAGVWCLVAGIKIGFINQFVGPGDEIVHEHIARQVSACLSAGKFSDAWWYFGAGNDGYRFLVGCFYAATGAPEVAVYFINGGLACWGLLSLLETLCRGTKASRVSVWLLLLVCISPSALFWSTTHLKEGPMLWSICMLLRGILLLSRDGKQGSLGLPCCGFMLGSFLRPHIMIAWVAAVFIAMAVSRRKMSIAVLGVLGMVASFFVLQSVAPNRAEALLNDGVTQTMQAGLYDRGANSTDGSTIRFAGNSPIPVVSGALLILLRPYPVEVFNLQSLLAGLEAWTVAALMAYGFLSTSRRHRISQLPMVIAAGIAFVALALFFSYMYNMGLMVRQRLQVFPALAILVAVPYLLDSARRGVVRATGRRSHGKLPVIVPHTN